MNNGNLDEETRMALAEAEAVSGMLESSGWSIAEKELRNLILQLRDARNLQRDLEPEKKVLEMEINLGVADNMEAWVDDLKGRVDNAIIMSDESNVSKLTTRR